MSEDLIQQYRLIHSREAYGNTSVKNLPYILPLIDELKPASIIDFGCGQSSLADELAKATGARTVRYDPAIPQHSVKPEGKFDLLVNVDVLEHVPEDELEPIIADMAAFAKDALIIIDMGPAVLILPDGRNAHVTQHDQDWWAMKLGAHFPYLEPIRVRSKRRAAFKTWKSPPGRGLTNLMIYLREEVKYHIRRRMRAFSRRNQA
ncbi:MAG: class I SAM-dependent methyltransferase [Beijerinckiaceae bacterium]|nr:class I SAM-dependent methyltransferase [Beijerinckiaceae bacterium]